MTEWVPTGGRRSGRTTRQLAALPDGGVYVVAHARDEAYCRDLLVKAGRRSDAVRFVPVSAAYDKLCAVPINTPVVVDHYVYERAHTPNREMDGLHIALTRLHP